MDSDDISNELNMNEEGYQQSSRNGSTVKNHQIPKRRTKRASDTHLTETEDVHQAKKRAMEKDLPDQFPTSSSPTETSQSVKQKKDNLDMGDENSILSSGSNAEECEVSDLSKEAEGKDPKNAGNSGNEGGDEMDQPTQSPASTSAVSPPDNKHFASLGQQDDFDQELNLNTNFEIRLEVVPLEPQYDFNSQKNYVENLKNGLKQTLAGNTVDSINFETE